MGSLAGRAAACAVLPLAGAVRAAGLLARGLARAPGVGRPAALLAARPLAGLYAAGIVAAGVFVGSTLVEARLASEETYAIDVRCLEIQERPLWLAENWVASIPNPFGDRRQVNLFEEGVVEKIHAAYESCPWIEEVCYVRKEFPNRLAVKIRVRTPVVALWEGDAFVLVDRTGVVLPRRFRTVPDFGFPVLEARGVDTLAPAPGRPWKDPAVEAAVALARLFGGQDDPVLQRVARADVSGVGRPSGRRTEINLYAREGGGRVEWGGSPVGRNPLEIPVQEKIENLRRLFAAYPDMRDVEYALVQFKDVYVLPRRSER